jgi:putative heme-binding domain-containing protein
MLAVLLFATPELAWAQRDLKEIPDPDPEIERKSFQVADGFEVNLFAADPQLAKPIQMNFDPQGRLWVASSEVYPQIQPGQTANDRILILEDTDGDGKPDKTTVFIDGLLIPTGVEPGDGGAYVANSTELVHFKDTNGDGKADARRVMLSGFGTEDTHHILHTFRWGMDGMLYFNQSIYIHSHLETPYGVRRLNGGGIWQFRPETMQLEVLARGFVNTWGHHVDRWGQSFATDGAGGEGINYVLPGAAYVTAVGVPRIVKGLNPGSPKYCGLELVSGRHFPDDWQGNAITNDFRGHRVCRFVLSEDGAGYASREETELIKTSHVAFRPIDIKMGPDGALYIADWYNPIIQHGEVDFRDPRRDHTHGRIWRVTAKGRPLVERPKLVEAPTGDLLDALKSPEDWTRQRAKRVLKERGGVKVVPELAAWVAGLDPADPNYEHQRLEGLWAYQALDVANLELLSSLLRAKDHRVRAAATRVVQHWAARLPNPLALLAEQVADEHPRVRLEAVRVLGNLPSVRSVEIAMQALDRPVDRFLDYALWLTARDLQPSWLPALQAGELHFGGNARHLTFALQSAGSPAVVKPLLSALQKGEISAERQASTLTLVAALGAADDLGAVFTLAVERRDPQLLSVLENATRQRNVRPDGDLSRVGQLLSSDDELLQSAAARTAGLWQVAALRPQLTALARGEKTTPALRQAALDGLAALGGGESRQTFIDLTEASFPPPIRISAAAALTQLDLPAAAKLTVELLPQLKAEADPAPLFEAFMQHKEGPQLLTAALENKQLPPDVTKIGVRTIRSSARQEPNLIEALSKSAGLKGGVQVLTPEQMQKMVADVADLGNAERGEAVFRRQEMACLRCHAIGGAGGQVGPDLVSIGASAQLDYLIDSLLQPNKQIKENYHSLVVVDDRGRIHSGVKVSQTDTELVLRNADDREIVLPLESIDEQSAGGSLMPAGLTDTLTRSELLDLVRFLSELGKIGPYAVNKARVVRRWQALQPTPEAARRLGLVKLDELAAEHPAWAWGSAYSQVSGNLPLAQVPIVALSPTTKLGCVRCDLDVSTPGKIQLRLNSADGLSLWMDGTRLKSDREIELDLPSGRHRLTLAVDPSQRKTDIRVELGDIPGSPIQVQLLGGK